MKKSLTLLLAALFFAASVAGCAPELYERALISAVGVDKTEDGCRVTVRAAQANAGGTEISLSGEGKTVPEALNEITRITGQQPLYSHNTLVVFGMDCAQDGLKEYLDFFLRHYDSRPTVKVFLSETTAEDILRVESAEEPRAAQIAELAKSADYSGLSADVNLIGLVNGTYGEGASAVVPILRRDERIEPAGTALLHDLSLRRTLSAAELHGLLLLQGALRAGQFVVADPECGDVTLAVRESDCEIRFTGTADAPRLKFPCRSWGRSAPFRAAGTTSAVQYFHALKKRWPHRPVKRWKPISPPRYTAPAATRPASAARCSAMRRRSGVRSPPIGHRSCPIPFLI